MERMDIVVRGPIPSDLDFMGRFEVRLGPCPWTSDKYEYVWRVSTPVLKERAVELVDELLQGLGSGTAFAMPKEFNITGRLEPVLTSGDMK